MALIQEALARSEEPLVADQVEYQPYLSQDAVREELRAHGMTLIAYSPLAQGYDAGAPGRIVLIQIETPDSLHADRRLRALADAAQGGAAIAHRSVRRRRGHPLPVTRADRPCQAALADRARGDP